MNNRDPYQILGVSPSATDEEVKTAYRELAKKYHPDHYTDNPLSELAEEKMQEINEAYDTIVRSRRQGGGYHGQQTGRSRYADVRSLIQQGRVADAETLLDGIPIANRDAEWHFLKGSVLYRKGWFEDAYHHFSTASSMDPSNTEYRAAVTRVEQQRQTGNYTGTAMGCNPCDICGGLLLLDCCCRGCR